METAINWFQARKGNVYYSMVDRNGPSSWDCSSAVYRALIEDGDFPSTIYIGNTDSLFGDLERHGFTVLTEDENGHIDSQRGDIFIWGTRGQSTGSLGHTGIFIDPNNIIHCSYGYNGIAISDHDWLWGINGRPPVTVYRKTVVTNQPVDQIIEVGSYVRFDKTYIIDEVQLYNQVWQVHTSELCKTGFTWDDNGIPAALLVEVDSDGYATEDQELAIGSLYKIPGKFVVTDIGQYNTSWMAKIGYGGLSFWVDIDTATEVSGDDTGTPTPSKRVPVIVVQPPTDTPPVAEPVAGPVTQVNETPEIVPVQPPVVNTSNNSNSSSISELLDEFHDIVLPEIKPPKEETVNQPTLTPTPKVAAVGTAGGAVAAIVTLLAVAGVIVPSGLSDQASAAVAAILIVVSFAQALIQFAAGYMKKDKKVEVK